MDYTQYVNILQGTHSERRYSYGNTLPLCAAPFGMNHFALQTHGQTRGWWFHPTALQCEGIRLTHQPSPWQGDWGEITFQPQSGSAFWKEDQRCSGFRAERLAPQEVRCHLKRYRATLSLTPTERCAVVRTAWQGDETPRLTFFPSDETAWMLDANARTLCGVMRCTAPSCGEHLNLHLFLRFDAPIDAAATLTKENGISLAFQKREVTMQMGTSFLSMEQAQRNLEREVGGKTYSEVLAETTEKWNELLSKIEIEDTQERTETFYSCLYRCFLFPRIFYELDENGKPWHHNFAEGAPAEGVMYTDTGFWDTCRTLFPLLTLLIPDRLHEMLVGFMQFYRDTGWLPKWPSPGERGTMPGTLGDATLADGAVKGILTKEEIALALEGTLKNATQESGVAVQGRQGTLFYCEHGYIPSDKYRESANNALDAIYCDYTIAQMAKLLGEEKVAAEMLRRSKNYVKLFDPETGFIRGMDSNGKRSANFHPDEWGNEYCEGSAWQNAFAVYHDVEGLAALYGGAEGLLAKMDELFSATPTYRIGSYGIEIHEMTEMAARDFGQCAISNQPSFHLPYFYSLLGQRGKTVHWVHRMLREAFNATEKGYPGDEDNGSTAGWFIFGTLGFYPFCPGKAEYVLSAPTCPVTLHLPGRDVRILPGEHDTVCADGKPLDNNLLPHEVLLCAEKLQF